MDIVYIRGLRVETVIGVYDWERRLRQTLVLDLEMAADIARAGASDDVADALDYDAVSRAVRALAAESDFALVEAFAEAVAGQVRDRFGVPWLRVAVRKPGAVADADGVGVIIERGKRERV